MKTDTIANGDLATLADLIDGIEVAMLTTRAVDGSLVSRPLQTLKADASGDLCFFTAADSSKVDELLADARVNLAYAHPGQQRYISVRGTASISRDRALIEELWSLAQQAFFPGGKDDPNLVVLRVRVRDADYWEAPGNLVSRALEITRAIVSDEPGDLGEHGKLVP